MATEGAITLYQNADQTVVVDILDPTTSPPGLPFDATGFEIDFYLKLNVNLADTDPSVVKLSTVGGQISLSIPPGGTVLSRATVTVAHTAVPTAYAGFWRCDVVGTKKVPCGYGPLTIIPQ
jgi:hypothetical protein